LWYELPAIVVSCNQSYLFHKTHLDLFSSHGGFYFYCSGHHIDAHLEETLSQQLHHLEGTSSIVRTQLVEFLDGSNPAPVEKLMIKVQKEKS
jgi:hypothetical protein